MSGPGPLISGFVLDCSLSSISSMFELQYWHETRAEWRPCGVKSADRGFVARALLGHQKMTKGLCRFRVVNTPVLA